MIRNCLSSLLILALLCSTGYFAFQSYNLSSQNAILVAKNVELEKRLAERHRIRERGEITDVAAEPILPSDPVQRAQMRLANAEQAIASGNIGDAIQQCKLATADIQYASSSTSAAARNSVAALQQRLNGIEQQTTGLLKRLGG